MQLTTERQVVMDIIQLLQGVQSETFVRDQGQRGVLFKMRWSSDGFNLSTTLSHLSQNTVKSILRTFLVLANKVQKTQFLFRGLKNKQDKLSCVMNSLIYIFSEIEGRFLSELDDLSQILLLQAGQISKTQLVINAQTFPWYATEPLTLMKLEEVIRPLFSKMDALADIMEKGILDFVAHSHNQQEGAKEHSVGMLFDGEQNQDLEPEEMSFLQIAEPEFKPQIAKTDLEPTNTQKQNFVSKIDNPLELPSALLNFEDIKPADRATYLLNFLYMQIQADQLMQDNYGRNLNVFKECFLVCFKPYLQLLNQWLSKGEEEHADQEFFIKRVSEMF